VKLLKPLEFLYQSVSRLKNFFYDRDFAHATDVGVPVISIGNLSFGGAGKTPCIIWLARELAAKKRITIVCRSYKSDLSSPLKVDLTKPDAALIYGDEACLIQSELPGCTVWSGPSKTETALAAVKDDHPQIILVDDGFSHRKLKRNFDLVLIDTTQGFESYQREYAGELKRAHAVILTKTHLASVRQIDFLKSKITEQIPHLKDSIFNAVTKINVPVSQAKPLFAFCGLARPESFWQDLAKAGYQVLKRTAFSDHQKYTDFEQKKIVAQFLDAKNEYKEIQMVTTAKDRIKLSDPELLKSVHVVQHAFDMDEKAKEALIAKIRSTL
jgi:tetraacyldisaccharide 4'-kinase